MRTLITGTTSGIGRAIALQTLADGHDVIAVNRRSLDESESLDGARHFTLDISDPSAVRQLFADLLEHGDLPEVFMLNAGINMPDNLSRFDIDVFRHVMEIDLMGAMSFVGAASELGLKNRRFVAFSSTTIIVPNPGHIGYFLAKKGLYDAFRLLRKTDAQNDYKVAVLGPIHSNIMRDSPPLIGLNKTIFRLLAASSEKAAEAIVAFSRSHRRALYFPFKAVAFYWCVRIVLFFLPALYAGSRTRGRG